MFVIYEMTRDVRIDPANMLKDRKNAVTDELNRLLSNRVLIDVGLCMALWDITSIGLGTSFPGDAGIHCHVVFRYIVFRPFQDEVIIGKIKKCTREGVHVTLGFFDDILIPPECLQYPSKFDEQEQVWIWEYHPEGEESSHEMYMDKGELLKLRITAEQFHDTTPVPAAAPIMGVPEAPESSTATKIPYSLTGSINEPGLGLLSWWS